MKRIIKGLSVLVAFTMLVGLFAGCSINELKLLNALKKTKTINSMNQITTLSLELSSSNLSKAEGKTYIPIINAFNGSGLKITTKMDSNPDKSVIKLQSDVALNAGDINTKFSIWEDYDQTIATKKNKLIMQVPSYLTSSMPIPAMKKYWVLDAQSLMPSTSPSVTISPSPTASASPEPKAINEKLTNLIYELAKKSNIGYDLFEKLPDEGTGDSALEVYKISFDNNKIKDLLKYLGNGYIDNKDVTDLLKDYLISMVETVVPASDVKTVKKQIDDAFLDFQNDHKSFTTSYNKVMTNIKNMNILGSKGMNFTFKVNKDGYVVDTSGVIDLSLNLKQLSDVANGMAAAIPAKGGTVNITLNYSNIISDINQEISIAFPTIIPATSFDVKNLTKITQMIPLKVNRVTNASRIVTGKTEPFAEVTIRNYEDYFELLNVTSPSMPTVVVTAKADGTFKAVFPTALKENSTLYITVENDYTSTYKMVSVLDVKPPKAPVIGVIKSNSTKIYGQSEPWSKVFVKNGSKLIGVTKLFYSYKFTLFVKKQKAGTVLKFIARDENGNYSPWVSKKVIK
ncbi:MAG: Ig-like domain-containing protein [Bacillota bacterium]